MIERILDSLKRVLKEAKKRAEVDHKED